MALSPVSLPVAGMYLLCWLFSCQGSSGRLLFQSFFALHYLLEVNTRFVPLFSKIFSFFYEFVSQNFFNASRSLIFLRE